MRAAVGDPVQAEIVQRPRTRTAVDRERGVSAESQLFSYAPVETTGLEWEFVVDAGRCADAETVQPILDLLEGGLIGLGKTEASVDIISARDADEAAAPGPAPASPDAPDLFAVTLMTPALMTDPADTAGPEEQYASFWRGALGEGVRLENFMARQRLTGGYLARRFRLYGADRYAPFHLTEPGSVFLLRCPDEASRGRLAEALRWNLPVRTPPGVTADWRNCPYTPENGFGAIVCNRVDHAALARRVDHV